MGLSSSAAIVGRDGGCRAIACGPARAAGADPPLRPPPMFLLLRFEAELLAADTGLEHQTALGHGEDGHAVAVVRGLRCAGLDGNRRGFCRHLEVALLEV